MPHHELPVIAVTHTTPSEAEQVSLYNERKIAIGTRVRGRRDDEVDPHALVHFEILADIANRGGLAVITYDVGRIRMLGRIDGGQTPLPTLGGVRTIQVSTWIDLPRDLAKVNSMGSAICRVTGEDADDVRRAAAAAGLL